jgi:mono/diheme cytochrome c family protein
MVGVVTFGAAAVVAAILLILSALRLGRAGSGAGLKLAAAGAGVLALVIGAAGAIDLVGVNAVNGTIAGPTSVPDTAATETRLSRGEHLAHLCAVCHSTTGNVPLDGSRKNLGEIGGISLGTLYAPNLTPAGPLAGWTDGEVLRALRQGVDASGHRLFLMPSDGFHVLSDDDAVAVVTYLRSQPPIDHPTPARELNVLGTIAVGAGLLGPAAQPPVQEPVPALQPETGAAYGKYMVTISGCWTCHGNDLAGFGTRAGSGSGNGPNLTLIVPRWTREEFLTTIRTGRDPNGYNLRPDLMPWQEFSAAYSDGELGALYDYLHQLQPIQR